MVGRGIALLFHDRSTRRWWVVSSTPRPHFIPGKEPVPILQEAGWILSYLVLCMYRFLRRWNRRTTHFSESMRVVKRRLFVQQVLAFRLQMSVMFPIYEKNKRKGSRAKYHKQSCKDKKHEKNKPDKLQTTWDAEGGESKLYIKLQLQIFWSFLR